MIRIGFKKIYTKPSVIENVYGDGNVNYLIKFPYVVYVFGKAFKYGSSIDRISFKDKASAVEYAMFAIKPSTLISDTFFQENRQIYTEHNKEIDDINVFMKNTWKKSKASKSVLNTFPMYKYSYPIYRRYKMAALDYSYIIVSGTLKNYHTISENSSLYAILDMTFSLVQNYVNEFTDAINNEFKSKTLVETNEIAVEHDTRLSAVNKNVCELDILRRTYIKEELERINTYKQSLIKLMK